MSEHWITAPLDSGQSWCQRKTRLSPNHARGSLPTTTIGAVLAPTAMRAYTYDQTGTVRIFDLSSTPVVEVLPAITLTGTPVSKQATLTITQDGGTLFLGLDSGIIITPTPP